MQGSVYLMRQAGPSQTLTVFRAGRVIYIDGIASEQKVTSYDITGNVQPLNGKDLLLVPEAQRTRDNILIFTEQNEKTPALNDRIYVDGGYYQVQNVENWGSYTKLRATREDTGPKASL